MPCAGSCGRLLWRGRGSLPAGELMCQACRKTAHVARRSKVCPICDVAFIGTYDDQRTCSSACAGVLLSRAVRPRCEVCTTQYKMVISKGVPQRTCSRACGIELRRREGRIGGVHAGYRPPPRSHVRYGRCVQCSLIWVESAPRRNMAEMTRCPVHVAALAAWRDAAQATGRTMRRAADVAARRAAYVAKPCEWCPMPIPFERGPLAAYCTERCARRARRANTGDRFKPTLAQRLRVHERDAYVCHLCRHQVRIDVPIDHPWSATLDHVVPQSLGGDHHDINLRTAHRWCNSARSDQYPPPVYASAPPVDWGIPYEQWPVSI